MEANTVLNFWFSDEKENHLIAQQQATLWWQKNSATDQTIQQRFEPVLKAFCAGQYDHWLSSAQGTLAAIILLDQFPRNIYRDSPQAFSFDALALHLTLQGIKQGLDKKLSLIERVFFYLPLEHSESNIMQSLSIEKYQQICDGAGDDFAQSANGFLDFAHQHKTIIDQFGRYPHRNEILKRSSTDQEIDFLQQPGSSF